MPAITEIAAGRRPTCLICNITYRNHRPFISHMKEIHNVNRPYICKDPGCGKDFLDQGNLDVHVRETHENERTFVCNVGNCSITCNTAARLQQHIDQVHLDIRPFACGECQSSFPTNTKLQRHIKNVHRNERPFTCNITDCGKSFHDADKLKRHVELIHRKPTESEKLRITSKEAAATEVKEPEHKKMKNQFEDVMYMGSYLLAGNTEDFQRDCLARNNRIKEQHKIPVKAVQGNVKIHYPNGTYEMSDVRTCLGVAGDPCLHTDYFDECNTFLKQVNGTLQLHARCAFCYYWQYQAKYATEKVTAAGLENLGLCVHGKACGQKAEYGYALCEKHRKEVKDRVTYRGITDSLKGAFVQQDSVFRARNRNLREDTIDYERLMAILQETKVPSDSELWRLYTMHCRQDQHLYYIDTEFAGKRLVHLAIRNPARDIVLNVVVDYEMGVDSILEMHNTHWIAQRVIRKYYGQQKATLRTDAERLTPSELVRELEALDFAQAVLVEWSINYCDWYLIKHFLASVGRLDLLPARSLRACVLMKKTYFHKFSGLGLEQIFPYFCPASNLLYQHHEADVDALKLIMVMEVAFEKSDDLNSVVLTRKLAEKASSKPVYGGVRKALSEVDPNVSRQPSASAGFQVASNNVKVEIKRAFDTAFGTESVSSKVPKAQKDSTPFASKEAKTNAKSVTLSKPKIVNSATPIASKAHRKKPEGSRAFRQLQTADVSQMKTMTSYFGKQATGI